MSEETRRIGDQAPVDAEQTEGSPADGLAVDIEIMPVPESPAPDPATREPKAVDPKWPPFTLGEVVYTFGHLIDFAFVCKDSEGVERSVLITFADHVFTRKAEPGDRPADAFPGCS